MSAPDPVLEAAVQALRIEGGDPGSSIHGWRCEYPARYGPCNCVAESAAEILAAVRPLIEAEVRERIAREIEAERPEGGHVVPCVVGCELGAQPVRPLIWTTSGWRMVAE